MLVPERIQQAARHSRFPLTFSAAENWSMLLRTRDYRVRMLSAIGASSPPQIESVPSFAQTLVADHNRRVSSVFSAFGLEVLTRGFIIRDWSEWRNVLRFRFVNPTAHMGVHANYANRLCGAEATILAQPKSDTVIYRAKWHPSCVQNGIAYRFVPL
jgi:hypothetical protein